MNWTRSILDGLAMAAYFNLFAAAAALYKPRLMFPCYPSAIIKAANRPPTREENRFYWLWICFHLVGMAPAVALRRPQRGGGRDTWFLAPGVDGLHPVDDGQPRRSVFP